MKTQATNTANNEMKRQLLIMKTIVLSVLVIGVTLVIAFSDKTYLIN